MAPDSKLYYDDVRLGLNSLLEPPSQTPQLVWEYLALTYSLGRQVAKSVVIHSTAYCGSLEKACLALGIPVLSISEIPVNHGFACTVVANGLLEAWGVNFPHENKLLMEKFWKHNPKKWALHPSPVGLEKWNWGGWKGITQIQSWLCGWFPDDCGPTRTPRLRGGKQLPYDPQWHSS